MENGQPGISAPAPRVGRYLTLSPKAGIEPRNALSDLVQIADGDSVVVGIGQPATVAPGKAILRLRPFPTKFGAGLVCRTLPVSGSYFGCPPTDAPADFIDKQLGAIVGIEIALTKLLGKWKVSQNRPRADREGVVRGLAERADADSAAIADWVKEKLQS